MTAKNYRSSNTDFVVTNDVIDFKFLYEDSSAEMLWTLSRSVTEVDGSTTNGGVGLLKANGEQGDWPLPSNLQRPLELEASRAIISGNDDVLVVVGFEYPSTSSGLGPLATIHYGSPASVPQVTPEPLKP